MRSDLQAELQTIPQVGENRAKTILSILEEHGIPIQEWDQFENDVVAMATQITETDRPGHAEKFALRVLETLEE